ncbi:DUF2125 domain-containing protein [Histidinibacterium lentulum]|nr:DUF2125 domain-containing protein [Histidinibacterium lentulum]
MIRLILVTALAALLYAGYWGLGARATLADARTLAEDLRAAGWEVDWSDISLRGFPSRLDLTVEDPSVRLPGGDGWHAPFLQSLQLSYSRDRAILVFPDRQTLTLSGTEIAVEDTALRASIRGSGITAEAETLGLSWPGHRVTSGPVLAALRPEPGAPDTLQLYLRADEVRVDGVPLGTLLIEGRAFLEPGDALPPGLAGIELTRLDTATSAGRAALAGAVAAISPAAAAEVQRQ